MKAPIVQRRQVAYGSDDPFLEPIALDFTGGINITDSQAYLPENQFKSIYNLYFDRNGQTYIRPPYRPETFSNTVQDKPVSVDYQQLVTAFEDYSVTVAGTVKATLVGHGFTTEDLVTHSGTTNYNGIHSITRIDADNYYFTETWVADEADTDSYATITLTPSTIHDYQAFRETLSLGWSYDGTIHVVTGIFTYTDTNLLVVAIYNTTSKSWVPVWSSVTATSVSVTPYKINEAYDLIIFPDDANPERWSPTATTGTLTDLGLIAPTVGAFTTVLTEASNTAGFTRALADVVYYKFAYYFDDKNVTTRFGESSPTAITTTSSKVLTVTTDNGQISIAFTDVSIPSGVSKIIIYRAPLNEIAGPYKKLGESDVSGADGAAGGTIETFVDTIEWGAEGVESLVDGTNPSASPVLSVVNVSTTGAYLVGFDASDTSKLVWCDTGTPDVWNPLNFDYLEGIGRAVVEFNRKLYAFTSIAVYEKESMGSIAQKISNIGCTDARSIQEVQTGIIWMDYDSVYFADFVTLYGSKGDFPMDIGHRLSTSIRRQDNNKPISSAFFERRYYISYEDSTDNARRMYVYDVDIKAWTQHSANHLVLTRSDNNLYSLNIGNGKYYTYKHDYIDVVSLDPSTYEGIDFHDYDSVTSSAFDDMTDILFNIKRESIQFAGNFNKAFVSSASLMVEGSYLDADVTLTGYKEDGTSYETSVNFTRLLGPAVIESHSAIWDNAVYAADSETTTATEAEAGFVGFSIGYTNRHKKVKRTMKSNKIDLLLTSSNSRGLKILGVGVYFKGLPPKA